MSADAVALIVDNLDLWTSATEQKSGAGRGGGKKLGLYGVERLRALVLDLALRGRLVPQLPSEGNGRDLLALISDELQQLVRAGAMRRAKSRRAVRESDFPFQIPPTWEWTHLEWLAVLENGDRGKNYPNKSALKVSGIPFVNAGHLKNGSIDQAHMTFISRDHYEKLGGGKFRNGDLLFCLRGSLGKSAIVSDLDEGAIASSLVIVRPARSCSPRFLLNYFNSELAAKMVKRFDNGTAQPNLSSASLGKFLVPIPPLAEQQRIVAKVDELMALCDTLEAGSAAAMDAHQSLVETLLATLVAAKNSADLSKQWARLEAHFDAVFTTEASIEALQRIALELAVRGKLVEQDPEDGSAALLLRDLTGDGSDRRRGKNGQSERATIADEEIPYELPDSWAWARFDQVAKVRAELVQALDHPDALQIAPDIIEKGTGKLLSIRTVNEAGVRGPNSRFYAGQIIYSKIRPSLSKAVIAEFDGLCSADMYPLDSRIDSAFLLNVILSESFLKQVRAAENRIKMPKLNKESLGSFIVAIPPLAEQRRIVAKVEELKALCDSLRANLAEAAETRKHLADAIVERAAA